MKRRWLLFTVFAATCALASVITRRYLMDDALITLRYARHLADHGSAVWNPPGSEARLLGYTSFGWMTVEAALALTVKDADALVLCAKLAAESALVLTAWIFADRLARSRASTRVALGFGLLLFANAGHGLHANSAMETMLFCAVTLLALWSRDRGQAPLVSYAWTALALLIRPEGILVAPALAWFDLRAGRRQAALMGCGLVLFTLIGVIIILIVAYDSPIPSAVSIKLGGLYPKRYAALSVTFFSLFCAPAFLATSILGAWRGHETSKLATAMVATLMIFLLCVRPIMNDCFRFEWPVLFWSVFGAIPVVEELTVFGWGWRVALGATLALNVRTSVIAMDRSWWAGVFYRTDRQLGRVVARMMRPGDWLGVVDAGAVPYFADVPTHDAFGLADGAGARRGPPLTVLCRPEVALVVVGDSDDAETAQELAKCDFRQRVNVPGLRCGTHWNAEGVFARDWVPVDSRALVSNVTWVDDCKQPICYSEINLASWNTWLWWDGVW